jgi:alpha-tubulin suppressor-like RCC1 family protein
MTTAKGGGFLSFTKIDFAFAGAVAGLTAEHIIVIGETGAVTKGALTGSGTSWSLGITVETEGDVAVKINRDGIDAEERVVTVWKAPAIGWSAQADGVDGLTDSTAITFAFDKVVEGLTAEQIVVADDTGSVAKGDLTGSGASWTLGITVNTAGTVKVSIAKEGIASAAKDVAVYKAGQIAELAWTAKADGGDGVLTSTYIGFAFSGEVTGLTAADISVADATGKVAKGELALDGAEWKLGITVESAGDVAVSIHKSGIETTTRKVAVYKNGESAKVSWKAEANGAEGATDTTAIAFTFSGVVVDLNTSHIAITGDTGAVTKGDLTGSGTNWSLGITVQTAGAIKVKINREGIEDTEEIVTVHKAPDSTYTATADGVANTTTSTKIDFAFSAAVEGLTAEQIAVADDTGSVVKGALAGSGTSWTLGITVNTAGTVKVSIAKAGIETTERVVAVYKAETTFPGITGFPIASSSSTTAGSTSGATLLLKSDGTVWATGNNRYGQFGNGTTLSSTPYITATFTQVAEDVIAVADNTQDTFIIKDGGSLWAAGRNNTGTHTSMTNTFEKEFNSGVKAVSVNGGILVLMENGDVYARGTNNYGQLGTGTTSDVTEWTKVASDVKAIAKSTYFSLILKNNDEVWGAGSNAFGSLGHMPDNGTTYPTFQKIFEGAMAIAVGSEPYSLILKNDGTLWGAGAPANGRLGNGNTEVVQTNNPLITAFTPIKDSEGNAISSVIAISAGYSHSLILKEDKSVWGTGVLNFAFEDNSTGANVGWFTRMVDSGVTKISAQGYQSFIIKTDGTLWVAGNVNRGILGNTAMEKALAFTRITLPE